MPKFPHLRTDSSFPDSGNVNVYQYDNQLDYTRYDYSQMEIQVCSVPWDMGEAHVGNRTIEGIGNVVKFADKTARDAWFDAIPDSECFRWETKYKDLHQGKHGDVNTYGEIRVPLPFDIAARYNYVRVRYHLFANDSSPLEYESTDGTQEWFYFIRQVNFIAPNTTELSLMDDAWQDWIYDVDITGMMLERGHAPMFATDFRMYLQNPIENNFNLLTDDVTFGELSQVTGTGQVLLNSDDVVACIVTSASARASWGTFKDENITTPAAAHVTTSGVPSYRVFSVPIDKFNDFLTNITETSPQFKQTVKGVFFIESKYLNKDETFEFGGVTCTHITGNSGYQTEQLLKLTPEMFGYEQDYWRIAKLYTWPYAAIELTDENGNREYVRVEDTSGTLTLSVAANLAFPFLNLTANIGGIGSRSGQSTTVKFTNLTEKSMPGSGLWYEHVRSWDVPTFAVILEAAREWDYSAHYDINQRKDEIATNRKIDHDVEELAKLNANATNDLEYGPIKDGQGNMKRRNDRTQNNENNLAERNLANINRDNSLNTKINGGSSSNQGLIPKFNYDMSVRNNQFLDTQNGTNSNVDFREASTSDFTSTASGLNNLKLNADIVTDNVLLGFTTIADLNAVAASGNVSGVSSVIQGGVNGVVGAAFGDVPGAIGGVATGIITGASAIATSNITMSKESSIASNTQQTNRNKGAFAYHYNTAMNSATKDYNNDVRRTKNQLAYDMTDEQNKTNLAKGNALYGPRTDDKGSSGIIKWNAYMTKEVEDTIATDTHAVNSDNNDRRYRYMYSGSNLPDNRLSVSQLRRDIANEKISNDTKQAGLRAPFEFGAIENAGTSTTRPMAMFANVVTQSESAIGRAGDIMLRYGYMYDGYWEFDGNWVLGKHFTYWKVSDFWVKGLNVPDMYMDRLRFFLFGGVTVWEKPEDIGNVSIYDNWKEG